MGIRSYVTAQQLIEAKKAKPVPRLLMKKAAAYDPQPKARVKPMVAGEPAIGTKLRTVRTQAMQTDDMRDRGNTGDKADFSYKPKAYQSRYGKGQTDEGSCMECGHEDHVMKKCMQCKSGGCAMEKGKGVFVYKKKTNPAAVRQIQDARANKMGNLDKAGPEVVHECPHCGELASKGCEHSVKAHADQTDVLGEA